MIVELLKRLSELTLLVEDTYTEIENTETTEE